MDLHKEFVKLSFDIIRMKNKLISLLLEIYEKEIYRKHGCRTIKEYGFKYAKLSGDVVDKALRTLKHVENKPCLKKMIETQGIHKVSMVATIATPKTDKMFAQHIENMSKPALFEFAKEIRNKNKTGQHSESGARNLFGEQNCAVPKCQAAPAKVTIELDQESQILFLGLKNKYAKDCSNKEALKVLLKKLEIETKNAKNTPLRPPSAGLRSVFFVPGNGIEKRSKTAETSQKEDGKEFAADGKLQNTSQIIQPSKEPVFPSHYIPAKQKKEILEKYNHKCAYPGCVKPAEHFHHRTAFSFEKNYESIIPLCEIHHQFAHNGIIKHESKEPEDWQLNMAGEKTFYDQLYLKYKKSS